MSDELKWLSLCAATALGEGLGFALEPWALLWPLPAAGAGLIILFGFGHAWRPWPFAAALFVGLSLALHTTEARQNTLDRLINTQAGRPCTADFTVGDDLHETISARGGHRLVFKGAIDGLPVYVSLPAGAADPAPRPGETWRCAGWLSQGEAGVFGRLRTLWVSGRTAWACRVATEGGFAAHLRAVRRNLSQRLGHALASQNEAADLNRAMLLGERQRIPRATREAFVAAGTIHVFAISGLHVLFIARLLVFALRLCRITPRAIGLLLPPLLWTYVVMVGCGPSAVRAATMATLYFAAPLFWRRPNGFTAWSIAFLLTYLREPAMLLDVGCGLSFAVMFALVVWHHCSRHATLPRFTRMPAVVAIAWAAGVPLSAHVFGRITYGGLIANLAAVPLAFCSVFGAVGGLVTGSFSAGLAAHLNNFSALSTTVLAGLSRTIGSQPWSSQTVAPWSFTTCAAWYAAFALILFVLGRRLRQQQAIL